MLPFSKHRAGMALSVLRLALGLLTALFGVSQSSPASSRVVINEIMFNPPGGKTADEWIELWNVSPQSASVGGWRFSKGIDFVLPARSLGAGAFLVVAADPGRFLELHPGFDTNRLVGGWLGSLANTDENLELVDAAGSVVNRVHYASEGDWATREQGSGPQEILGITRTGTTAAVQVFGHGFTTGDQVIISGADQPEYNGRFGVSGVQPSSFRINVPASAASPATGTMRVRLVVDNGTTGWSWSSLADGLGTSLELIQPTLSNDLGQNWSSSLTPGGSPGQTNSVWARDVAPLILDVRHSPAVPRSTDRPVVTARIQNEEDDLEAAVTLYYRDHSGRSPGLFQFVAMADDGVHGDGQPGDGIYGFQFPTLTNGTVMEFYVEAVDLAGLTRRWPAFASLTNGLPSPSANALFQVSDEVISASMPSVRVVMTGSERAVFPPDNRNGDAQMNATLITSYGDATDVRYLCGVRVRGAGSRSQTPPNNRVNIPNDRRWRGMDAINLNSQYVHSQLIGGAVAREAGLPGSAAYLVQYRINGVNPTPITAPGTAGSRGGAGYGAYLFVEPVNGTLAESLFPQDGGGNVYRASAGQHTADLTYQGTDPSSYLGRGYFKASNQGENDWSDLQDLTFNFSEIASQAEFTQAIQTNVNVGMWMRYFAVGTLLNFGETSLFNGRGDDYAMYRGERDPRFVLIGHDYDTVLGMGDTTTSYPTLTNSSIYIMLNPPNSSGRGAANVPVLKRFVTNEVFVPYLFSELKRIADTVLEPTHFNALVDQLVGPWENGPSETTVNRIKEHAARRRAVVLAQIPLELTLNHGVKTLSNGIPYTTKATLALSGAAHAIETRQVRVNGQPATWSAWEARWSAGLTLQPGVNHILVESLNSNAVVFAQTSADIWFDRLGFENVGGTINQAVTWMASAGPYRVTNALAIEAQGLLSIEPGTTVYLDTGVGITVANGGRVLAEGTPGAWIRFLSTPGQSNWTGIRLQGGPGSPEHRFSNVEMDGNDSTGIRAADSDLRLDHVIFRNPGRQYVSLDRCSFTVQDCYFPTATRGFELVHGTGGIKAGGRGRFLRNFFGAANGYNDVVDFTGGNRPGPIVEFIGNVFMGSGDDLLDLDSTDAWVQHNIFLHAHRNGSPDSASAISGGADNSDTSQITVVGNLFYDVDQAALAKQGNFYTFLNNTIVRQTAEGGVDTDSGVIALADVRTELGAGMYLEGNILQSITKLVRTQGVAVVTFTNNLMPLPWTGPGGSNTIADPEFVGPSESLDTRFITDWASAQVLWDYFSLRPSSPARNAGPGGRDQGAVVPVGVAVSGAPAGRTPERRVTLEVGPNRKGSGIPTAGWPAGSGYTHYRWRLDAGEWSGEVPITQKLVLENLSDGAHQVEVVGRLDSGTYQNEPDLGPFASVTATPTWIVDASGSSIRLNEVLAANRTVWTEGQTTPDLVELFNAGDTVVSLAGWGLSDDPSDPGKFRFPAGVKLDPGAYVLLVGGSGSASTNFHLGFGLSQGGDALYLFGPAERGNPMLDSVEFGLQLVDLSIGRDSTGSWELQRPTPGARNRAVELGSAQALRINEWLAVGAAPFPSDFVELLNLDPRPVALGGHYLTDNVIGDLQRHRFVPLSFIGGGEHLSLWADGDLASGADHLSFALSADGGQIALYDEVLRLLDIAYYTPQLPNISQGRSPSGADLIVSFSEPTPGGANRAPTANPLGGALVINEVLASNAGLVEDGRTPDWVELYNGTTNTVDLADLSLTDDASQPRRFVFPAGVSLPPAGFLRVRCDAGAPAAPDNTGFSLEASSGSLFLLDSPTRGGGELSAVTYGLQAADLSIGRVPDGSTNWMLNTSTPNASNRAIPVLGDISHLKVNEWLADPPSGEDDWFEIYNPDPLPLALAGLRLTDDLANLVKHTLPPLSFMGFGTNAWLQFVADGNTGKGANHVNFSLRGSGEALGIATPDGKLIDGVTFGLQTPGVTTGRFPDGQTSLVSFPGTASPAQSNWRELSGVAINEVLTHTALPYEDAIEVVNLTDRELDLGGWWLSDDPSFLQKYRLPFPTKVPPFGFAVIYENEFGSPETAALPMGLSSGGDEVVLSAVVDGTLTGFRTAVHFGAQSSALSFGRYRTSEGRVEFVTMDRPTFGVSNPVSVDSFRAGKGATNSLPRVGPLVVSELMYHPRESVELSQLTGEYVEIQNVGGAVLNLYDPLAAAQGWRIRGGISFDFAANTRLNPGEFLVVVAFDPLVNPATLAEFRARYAVPATVRVVGPFSGKLNNAGDAVTLSRPDLASDGEENQVVIERIDYGTALPWPTGAAGTGQSLQRRVPVSFGDDPNAWSVGIPNPGSSPGAGDSDGDGLPDAWETEHQLNPQDPTDAGQDPDGDGLTNLEEYGLGSDPREARSGLRFTAIRVAVDGQSVVLSFPVLAGRSYAIEATRRIALDPWQPVVTVEASGSNRVVDRTLPISGAAQLFRLRTLVP